LELPKKGPSGSKASLDLGKRPNLPLIPNNAAAGNPKS